MPLTTRDTASMLTTKEVAALLQIDRNTLFEYRKAGRIKAVKFGTGRTAPVRYERAEVEAFMSGRTAGA